ncbi:bifunctional 3-(3-hydroxy-phenyl)propionate/3-hydroxycinnamic acid hydroxylase [Gordonia sp. zg691]|uniref:bifunctional 3-(3-hydroxy-phenyl)propionate/3-hydroxycinnamic acid hydroxylase n=1 Tax=Gordonia jinghuaiqii TaxID=2758710 RepID=UPI00166227F0|nr:bifunctional 3-(3-hydroxy-phenyl)propionate/3-hydroxycinnamic acid hydroxylase [Gordonia jinghuaiqii]MBD0862594.1 bifunctional 3-(3-hydroxy-phenyl)propionate/3-hydroxycinnamic acid hydroxylase [Gordonia jinghuaiqii]
MTAEDPLDTDVLIVGMGPTGVALAGLLGQHGIRTVIFDRLPGLYPLPRAAGMDHEVMRIAQELQISEALRPFVVPYRASQYRGVDGQVIKRLDSPPAPHRLGWEPMFAFNQPAFENLLRERIAQMPCVDVSLECDVTDVGQEAGAAWVDVRRSGSDVVERVTGRYLVGCDGGSSFVRRTLGITLTDLGFHENFVVIDAIVGDEALSHLPATHVQFCEPERPSTFVVLPGRHRRWEIMLNPGELPIGPIPDDDVWPFLERWIKPGDAEIWRSAAYMFHGLVADRWRDRRIFLAGDAAHMTPPFMAQGMAQGMRDAQNLAWKLRKAIADPTVAERLLDSYESERRAHVISTTGRTIELGRVICERDVDRARQRDESLAGPPGTEVPVTYRSSFLPPLIDGVIATQTAGAGEIIPQPYVDGTHGPTLLDDAGGHGFRVIVTPEIEATEADLLDAALAPLGGRVLRIFPEQAALPPADPRVFAEIGDVLTGWFVKLGVAVAIVRPDHYVYATARNAVEARTHLLDLVSSITAQQSFSARQSS